MRHSLALAFTLALTACAQTSAHRIDVTPRQVTCAAAIHTYLKPDSVGAPYQELAYLSVSGGALASGLLESPNGQAIAIYIPSDTARIAAECRRKVPA